MIGRGVKSQFDLLNSMDLSDHLEPTPFSICELEPEIGSELIIFNLNLITTRPIYNLI